MINQCHNVMSIITFSMLSKSVRLGVGWPVRHPTGMSPLSPFLCPILLVIVSNLSPILSLVPCPPFASLVSLLVLVTVLSLLVCDCVSLVSLLVPFVPLVSLMLVINMFAKLLLYTGLVFQIGGAGRRENYTERILDEKLLLCQVWGQGWMLPFFSDLVAVPSLGSGLELYRIKMNQR